MAENQSKKQDKQYQIPMMVTDEVIRDFGIKPEDVTWRCIGNRKCRVVLVDASEEEYKAYMAPIWAEIKREDRDGRCMVKGKNGRLIRCPESNRCEECKHFSETSRERNKPASLSVLMDEGAEPIAESPFWWPTGTSMILTASRSGCGCGRSALQGWILTPASQSGAEANSRWR